MTIAKCPFCGGECAVSPAPRALVGAAVRCKRLGCGYTSRMVLSFDEAISAHNLVSRSAEQVKIAEQLITEMRDEYHGAMEGEGEPEFGIYSGVAGQCNRILARIKASDTDTKATQE